MGLPKIFKKSTADDRGGDVCDEVLCLSDTAIIHCDADGKIRRIRPPKNVFNITEEFLGKDIGRIYANKSLPDKVRQMLASGAAISDYDTLLAVERGILAIHGQKDSGMMYDAILIISGRFHAARVFDKPTKDSAGRITAYTTFLTDVTLEHSLKHELSIASRRFEHLTRHINDIVYLRDAEGGINYVSPSAEEILGYPEDDLLVNLDRWPLEFKTEVDLGGPNTFSCNILDSKGRIKRFDGKETHIKDEDGRLIAIQGVLRHTTEMHESRAHLKAMAGHAQALHGLCEEIVSSIPNPAAVIDDRLRIKWANKPFDRQMIDDDSFRIAVYEAIESGKPLMMGDNAYCGGGSFISLTPVGRRHVLAMLTEVGRQARQGGKGRKKAIKKRKSG